jgi:hypothetical protein
MQYQRWLKSRNIEMGQREQHSKTELEHRPIAKQCLRPRSILYDCFWVQATYRCCAVPSKYLKWRNVGNIASTHTHTSPRHTIHISTGLPRKPQTFNSFDAGRPQMLHVISRRINLSLFGFLPHSCIQSNLVLQLPFSVMHFECFQLNKC